MRDVSLRAKVVVYFVVIHLAFAGIALLVLRENRVWLLAVEALLAISIAAGVKLVRAFFVPLDLIRTGTELIAERDFGSRFREAGQPEMDALVRMYNEMVGQLREERLRLREQHHFLDSLLAASPAGVATLDFESRVAQLNPAAERLLGVTNPTAKSRALAELPPPLGPALAAIEVGESTVVALSEGRKIKASRAEFYDRGFPRSFFLLEELTAELWASERAAYGKLIRMISHEVNNSVGAVGSLLESLVDLGANLPAADQPDYGSAIGVAATRLRNLQSFTHGFAEVVRLPPAEKRPTDLGRLLDELLILFRSEFLGRQIRIVWSERREPPALDLDRNQIEQVLVNVIKNAFESIGREGEISLRLTPQALTIRDSGPGLAPDAEAFLFTPFWSTKRDGRGLGLTLVREILTQHGWTFQLRNWTEGEKRGAEFRMTW